MHCFHKLLPMLFINFSSLFLLLFFLSSCTSPPKNHINLFNDIAYLKLSNAFIPVNIDIDGNKSSLTWVVDVKPNHWVFVVLSGERRVGTVICYNKGCKVDSMWPFNRSDISKMHSVFSWAVAKWPQNSSICSTKNKKNKLEKVELNCKSGNDSINIVYNSRPYQKMSIMVIQGKHMYKWVMNEVKIG